jgi:dinuclear metal center YbgI/SA1388 family protein
MVKVKDILAWIDEYAPFRYAASWDQCGLQVGDPEAAVERVMAALDPSSSSVEAAERQGCQCLVTHHPLLFRPINSVRLDQFPGNVIGRALGKGIHLIAAHTNLDAAREGTNDQLARLMKLEAVEPMEIESAWRQEQSYRGMGRVGFLPRAQPLANLVEDLRDCLGGIGVRVVGDPKRTVHRVALCSGSGGGMLDMAIASNVDAYITGDLKYHEGQRALEADLALIDIGHFASERLIVQPLADHLQARASRELIGLEVFTACEEKDPFWFF